MRAGGGTSANAWLLGESDLAGRATRATGSVALPNPPLAPPRRGTRRRRLRINSNHQPEIPMKPESWPDGPPKTATQGQLEAGPALTEIEPHVAESFLG